MCEGGWGDCTERVAGSFIFFLVLFLPRYPHPRAVMVALRHNDLRLPWPVCEYILTLPDPDEHQIIISLTVVAAPRIYVQFRSMWPAANCDMHSSP